MKTTRSPLTLSLILACALATLPLQPTCAALGQTSVGRISGTVTDGSGAAVPDATIKVTSDETGATRVVTTDDKGFYIATNLLPGNYTVSAERQGFKKSVKTGYSLVADGRLTVDLGLEAGAVSESITVTAANTETINTTSGEVARVVDAAQVQELALNGRNYMQLTTLIPGAPFLVDDNLELMTNLSVNQPINGNRGNANLLTVDGGFNLDSGSNNSQINNVGIDFIHEVKIQTSNFSAEYGRNSGAAINVVTKSGSNRLHGSLFEFIRNDKLDANNFFNNARGRYTDNPAAKAPDVIVAAGDGRVGQKVVERRPLRYNNFGFSIGGPIVKDKFFVFGGIEWKLIRRFSQKSATLPTRAERRGDFTGRSGTLNLPGTSVPVPGRNISSLITADGRAFAALYDQMDQIAAAYQDTPTANNALFQVSNPFDFRQDIVRLDYTISSNQTLYGRYLHDNYNLIDPYGTFINAALPTIPTNRVRPGYGYQIGHTWLITPRLINEAKVGASWNGQRVPPVGDLWKRDTYGFVFPQLFSGGRFDNGIPNFTISGFTGSEGPSRSLLSPTTDISFGDNLTFTHGQHSLRTGALVIRNRKDQNGRSIYTGNVDFNPSGNNRTTGNGFADALLGNFRRYSEAADDPVGFFRFTQIEAYVTDTWKFRPELSIEFGMRYQRQVPIYTQANNIVNFDPNLYDPAQAVTILANGNIDPTKGGNRFNGLVRAGEGVPPEEIGRVSNANSADVQAVPAGAPRGLYDTQSAIEPRISFAWSPFNDGKTAIRGGFGIYHDRPEGNIIFSQLNIAPFVNSIQYENGNISNPAGGRTTPPAPFGNITALDPALKLPYTMNWSVSVQRELPGGLFGEVAYVSTLGRHLLRQPDINAASFEDLLANQLLPSAQRKSVNALRPYKGFSQINMRLSDATSNYHGLQLYAAKRKGDFTMTASYTWSKALGDASGNGDTVEVGEDPFNRKADYGPLSYDRRHIFVATYIYRIPFFAGANQYLKGAIGGWEVSGITRVQSAALFTVSGGTAIGTRRADYLGGEVELTGSERSPEHWFNTKAFAPAPDTRFGNSGVRILAGPGRYLWDLSLRKKFSITESIRMQFQADFFNAFNQTNLGSPDTNFGSVTSPRASFGTISDAAPGRNIQLGLKLTF